MNDVDRTSTDARLWFALLAGPLAWTAHELLSYALVKLDCGTGFGVMQAVVTIATLACVVGGGWVAFRAYGSNIHVPRTSAEFLALAGLLGSVLFGFAIVLEALPELVIDPCL